LSRRLTFDTDPDEVIEVYHLHCHFTSQTEGKAQQLLQSTRQAIGGGLHDHVWHEKNGPHIGYSWELWCEDCEALGVAVNHFMSSRPAELHLCLHCDSDQEYTDHSCRLAFVGPADALHLEFFAPPDYSTYKGPTGPRRTSSTHIYSMGEMWERTSLRQNYGAMGRPSEGSQPALSKPQNSGAALQPALFLPHGSPPIPIERCKSEDWLLGAAATLPSKPKAIIFMSPHYKRDAFTVSTCAAPSTIMDFDDDTDPEKLILLEKLSYPAAGAPELAHTVARLIRESGHSCDTNPKRGMDHGVWTPLYVMFPDADVPVVSISVRADLDAAAHIAVGRALAPLAAQGVLLLGSGEVVHNVPLMGARDSTPQWWCVRFEEWLEKTMVLVPGAKRDAMLAEFRQRAPGAEQAHPVSQEWPAEKALDRPFSSPGEHIMPWFFAYGAGGEHTRGECVHKEYLGSLPMAAYQFSPSVNISRL